MLKFNSYTRLLLLLLLLAAGASTWKTVAQQALANPDEELEQIHQTPKVIVIKGTGYKPQPASEASREGEQRFKDLNCMACHSIHNVGGRIGPMLDGVGAHRSEEYLLTHLINSQEAKEKFAQLTGNDVDFLHHPRISEKSAKLITSYLLTVPEPAGGFILLPHTMRLMAEAPVNNPQYKASPATDFSRQGEKLYNDLGCAACHSINNLGGWFGPSLDGIGGRHNRDYVMSNITSSAIEARQSGSEFSEPPKMPPFNLSKKDLEMLTDYLFTLPNPK